MYLRRTDRDLTLTSEHRAAPCAAPIALELIEHDEALALEVRTGAPVPPAAAPRPADERIKQALVDAGGPLGIAELRERCRIRNATLHERLRALLRAGFLVLWCEKPKATFWSRLKRNLPARLAFPFPPSL